MKNLLIVLLVCASNYVQAQCDSATYTEPQFTISVQNPACPVVGEIKVTSASGGTQPYTFTLKPDNITNSTGTFSNLTPGSYLVQMKDACGTIRTRQATITPYNFTTFSSFSSLGCKNFSFNINCSATGPALEYGYALNGSTNIIWGNSAQINLALEAQTNVALYVKDSCGNQAVSQQYIPKEMMGYIKELQERIMCKGQEIYPVYYGFNAPTVCLYKYPQRTLVECKQAPTANYTGGAETNFFSLPFGQDYYVIVEDKCYRDSAFFKDKTSAGGSELNPFNWKCNTFDIHADGNNYDTVCLWNAATNTLVSCKSWTDTSINPNTGKPWPYGGAEWYDLPYGSYYAFIFDPCLDTLLRIDTTVIYPRNFTTEMYYACYITQSAIGSYFGPESPRPHSTSIYYPDGTLAANYVDAGTDLWYATWPYPGTMTVIQEDGCGYKDTSQLHQPDIVPSRTISFRGGCPGINGASGGGDIILFGNAFAYGGRGNAAPVATVRIIKKDGVPVNIPQSNTQWNSITQQQEYYFTNLTTGIYILESTVGCEGYKIYDTTEVKPYVYPRQEQTNLLQCGINPFVFKDTVTGGVGPYTYEIIGTSPNWPALLNGPQVSNIFSIPPGTNLNSITIQIFDACSNSNTRTFPVVHSASCDPLFVDSLTSLGQLQNKPIRVYPNPSVKSFNISISQKKRTDYEISVHSILGIHILTKVYRNIDTKIITIDENLKTGTYIIEVRDMNSGKKYQSKQTVM